MIDFEYAIAIHMMRICIVYCQQKSIELEMLFSSYSTAKCCFPWE